MTESPSTGSGGQSSVLYPDGLPVYREILCPHNTVIQTSRLSIHICQHAILLLAFKGRQISFVGLQQRTHTTLECRLDRSST